MSEKMIFCLGYGKYESSGEGYQKNHRIFNQDVTDEVYESTKKLLNDNEIKITLTKWVEEKDLDKSEKTTTTKELGGLLKTFSYEEAWANFWNEATQKQKNTILDLPQFDAEIFKKITGIDASKQDDAFDQARKLLEKNGYKIVKE